MDCARRGHCNLMNILENSAKLVLLAIAWREPIT